MKRICLGLCLLLSLAAAEFITVPYQGQKQVVLNDILDVFILENPQLISVDLKTNLLKISGRHPGLSRLIVRTLSGPQVFNIRVEGRQVKLPKRSIVDWTGRKFFSNLSMGYGRGDSSSLFAAQNWGYAYMYYKLETKGKTPWGDLYNIIAVKNKREFQGVYEFKTILDNEYGKFIFGDQMPEKKSSLIFPYQPLQGLSWEGTIGAWQGFAFTGLNNFGNWGYVLEREEQPPEQVHYMQAWYPLTNLMKIGLNYSNYGYSLAWNQILREFLLQAEVGQDYNQNNGRDIKLSFRNRRGLQSSVRFLHIDDGFNLPVGLENYEGYNGLQYQASLRPDRFWQWRYMGETYRKLESGQELHQQNDAFQATYRAQDRMAWAPELGLSWLQNQHSTPQGYHGVQNTYQLKASKETSLGSFWYRFHPMTFKKVNDSTGDYTLMRNSVGFKVPLLKTWTYQGEMTLLNHNGVTQNYTEQLYDGFLVLNPIPFLLKDLTLHAFYQHQSKVNLDTSLLYWLQLIKVEFKYTLNADGDLRLKFYRRINDEPNANAADNNLDEVRIEYSQNFDYSVQFSSGRSQITGIVFQDTDYNGEFDTGERGVPGIAVKLSTGETATTNSSGVYKFNRVPNGEHILHLESKDQQILFTDEHPKYYSIDRSMRVVANFGVIVSPKIYGQVFIDINGNGFKDGIEEGIPGVRVIINDEIVETDAQGFYSMPSDENALYNLQVDLSSVPLTYTLKGARNSQVTGRTRRDFVFEPRIDVLSIHNLIDFYMIKTEGKNRVKVRGAYKPGVTTIFINDRRATMKDGQFFIDVPRIGEKIKVKFFTDDKRSFIQMVGYIE